VERDYISLKFSRSLDLFPEKFELVIPFDDKTIDDYRGKWIEVYSEDDTLLFKGQIEKIVEEKSTQGFFWRFSGRSNKLKLLQKLFRNDSGDIKFTYSDTNPSTIVSKIISQADLNEGTINTYSENLTLRFKYEFCIEALREIIAITGWEVDIKPDDTVDFKSSIGDDKTSSIILNLGEEITVLKKIDDIGNLKNRLYGFGKGVPDEQASFEILAQVEDTDSINTYGLREGVVIDRRFVYQSSMEKYLQTLLEDLKKPRKGFEIEIGFLPEGLYIGDKVRVMIDEDDYLDLRIISITYNITATNISYQLSLADLVHQANLGKYKDVKGVVMELKQISTATTYDMGERISIQSNIQDNADENHPLKFRFRVDDDVIGIKYFKLYVWGDKFRAYSQANTDLNVEEDVYTGPQIPLSSTGEGVEETNENYKTGDHTWSCPNYPSPSELDHLDITVPNLPSGYSLAGFEIFGRFKLSLDFYGYTTWVRIYYKFTIKNNTTGEVYWSYNGYLFIPSSGGSDEVVKEKTIIFGDDNDIQGDTIRYIVEITGIEHGNSNECNIVNYLTLSWELGNSSTKDYVKTQGGHKHKSKLASHSHGITPGIFEETFSPETVDIVLVKPDNSEVNIASDTSLPWNGDISSNLDQSGVYTIKITPNTKGRLEAFYDGLFYIK